MNTLIFRTFELAFEGGFFLAVFMKNMVDHLGVNIRVYLELVPFLSWWYVYVTITLTFQIVEYITQIRCRLVQLGDVLINTITCKLKMYGHFGFVGEGVDYIHSKPHNVICTQCISALQIIIEF